MPSLHPLYGSAEYGPAGTMPEVAMAEMYQDMYSPQSYEFGCCAASGKSKMRRSILAYVVFVQTRLISFIKSRTDCMAS